jgi:broad specificity polyphosphatase/5'/3'-nucleotidase SurE
MKPVFKLLLTDENYKDRVHTQTDTQRERYNYTKEKHKHTPSQTDTQTDRNEKNIFKLLLTEINFTKTLNKASF